MSLEPHWNDLEEFTQSERNTSKNVSMIHACRSASVDLLILQLILVVSMICTDHPYSTSVEADESVKIDVHFVMARKAVNTLGFVCGELYESRNPRSLGEMLHCDPLQSYSIWTCIAFVGWHVVYSLRTNACRTFHCKSRSQTLLLCYVFAFALCRAPLQTSLAPRSGR